MRPPPAPPAHPTHPAPNRPTPHRQGHARVMACDRGGGAVAATVATAAATAAVAVHCRCAGRGCPRRRGLVRKGPARAAAAASPRHAYPAGRPPQRKRSLRLWGGGCIYLPCGGGAKGTPTTAGAYGCRHAAATERGRWVQPLPRLPRQHSAGGSRRGRGHWRRRRFEAAVGEGGAACRWRSRVAHPTRFSSANDPRVGRRTVGRASGRAGGRGWAPVTLRSLGRKGRGGVGAVALVLHDDAPD